MKKLNKKGAFDTINAGMIAFISFVLIVVLVVLLVAVVRETSIVCPQTYDDGVCLSCPALYTFNSSANLCCNSTGTPYSCASANTINYVEYTGSAYNATTDLQEGANLPSQFAQIIVIVVIIVGILGMLAFVGFGAYRKLKG